MDVPPLNVSARLRRPGAAPALISFGILCTLLALFGSALAQPVAPSRVDEQTIRPVLLLDRLAALAEGRLFAQVDPDAPAEVRAHAGKLLVTTANGLFELDPALGRTRLVPGQPAAGRFGRSPFLLSAGAGALRPATRAALKQALYQPGVAGAPLVLGRLEGGETERLLVVGKEGPFVLDTAGDVIEPVTLPTLDGVADWQGAVFLPNPQGGHLWVALPGTGRLVRLDLERRDGGVAAVQGFEVELGDKRVALQADPATDQLWVLERGQARVQVLDGEGRTVRTLRLPADIDWQQLALAGNAQEVETLYLLSGQDRVGQVWSAPVDALKLLEPESDLRLRDGRLRLRFNRPFARETLSRLEVRLTRADSSGSLVAVRVVPEDGPWLRLEVDPGARGVASLELAGGLTDIQGNRLLAVRVPVSMVAPIDPTATARTQTQAAGDSTAASPPSAPTGIELNFSAAVAGTVADKDGQGTGFASVQPNAAGNQYDPSRIDLDTTKGSLALTATKGSNSRTVDTLKNALELPVDASVPWSASIRLLGSPSTLTTAYQQAGLYLGTGKDNYVKFVVINITSGSGGLGLQFAAEQNGSLVTVGQGNSLQVTGLAWSSITTLDLILSGDPASGTISAAYRVNSNTAPAVTLTQKLVLGTGSAFFGATGVRSGIVATTVDAADVTVRFDRFGFAYPAYALQASSLPNRAAPVPLNGGTYAGNLYILLASTAGVYQVEFYLDNPAATGTPLQTEKTAPYDYAGGSTLANPLVTTGIADGPHTVTARVTLTTGAVQLVNSSFTVANRGSANRPVVASTNPASGGVGILRDAAISADLILPNIGAGVDQDTLSPDTVRLLRATDNQPVTAVLNTSGGGDSIVLQPTSPLASSTTYVFQVAEGLKDESGAAFVPFTMTFTTGSTTTTQTPGTSFIRQVVYDGSPLSSLLVGPDGRLYAASLDGILRRWTIAADGTLSGLETYGGLEGRAIIGIVFDPTDPNLLWISHSATVFVQPAPDFSGRISRLRLTSTGFSGTFEDYVIGLPRSAKDHMTNSLAFGPDGRLYVNQGSNSATGAPDSVWYERSEHLLTAAVLQIDPRRTGSLPFNVQTDADSNYSGPLYNPSAADAPVKVYGAGVRNAYDLVWHSNGRLYVPTNGSAAGGNTPASPSGVSPVVPAITKAPTQPDFLFKVEQGGYYGHPNPTRGQYAMNGADPTSGVDPAEVVTVGAYNGYPVGVLPDVNYRGFAYNFGTNRSPNGAIEYKSNTFSGTLKGKLLVVEYSGGDDILALTPGTDGNIGAVTQLAASFSDPLDLTEDTRNGNLYVAELVDGGQGGGLISLLKVNPNPLSAQPNLVVAPTSADFGTVAAGTTSNSLTLILNNVSKADLIVSALALGGTNPGQFVLLGPPSLPLTVRAGGVTSLKVAFKPTVSGPQSAQLQIQSNDPDPPSLSVPLSGVGQAASTVGKVGVQNPFDVAPFPSRFAFSRIGSLTNPPSNSVHDKSTVRITNSGTGALTLTGLPITGAWALVNPPMLPASIAAGGSLDIQLLFKTECCDYNSGTLTIQSDDASQPSLPVELGGFWQSVPEGDQEPTLVEIVKDAMGYTTSIAYSGQSLDQKGLVAAVGEEVLSPYWLRADTAKPVSVRQLAAYHPQSNVASVYWHAKGSSTLTTLFTQMSSDGQTVLPRLSGSGNGQAASGSFNPTGAFGFKIDGEWSDDTKNNQSKDQSNGCPGPCGHHVRFWPARDRTGAVIPNTYLMSMSYAEVNYKYQDNVYLISNVKLETSP